jgi:hypothetical protein
MSKFICPNCSTHSQLFPSTTGGALGMCKEELSKGLELLASLPLDPRLGKSLDQGNAGIFFEKLENSIVHQEFEKLAKSIFKKCKNYKQEVNEENEKLENGMSKLEK